MALKFPDRTRETTTSTGTGAITLAGAEPMHRAFSAELANADTCYFVIAARDGSGWEECLGTYTAASNSLSRDTVIRSSNANAAVDFGAGVKDVFAVWPGSILVPISQGGTGAATAAAAISALGGPALALLSTLTPATTGDADFSTVKLLLDFEGEAEGSTNITDRSLVNRAIAVAGNAHITTASSKWGTGCATFDGTGDYLYASYSPTDMDWWTGDYTLELWVDPTTLSTFEYTDGIVKSALIGCASPTSGSNYWSFGPIGTGAIKFCYWNGAAQAITSTATVTAGQYSHIALVKSGSGVNIFVNGVGLTGGPVAISGTPQSSTSGVSLVIGQINNRSILGRVDDIRIRRKAQYTADFTPPTGPFPTSEGIQLPLFAGGAAELQEISSPMRGFLGAGTIQDALGKLGLDPVDNVLHNGNFQVAQRGTSFAGAANGICHIDRWGYYKTGAMVHTIAQSTDVPTVAQAGVHLGYSMHLTLTTADTSLAAGDFCLLSQGIEGLNFLAIAQRACTLSFWIKATLTGTYCVAYRSSAGDRSYIGEFTVNASETWEYKAVALEASPVGGTWPIDNTRSAEICFVLASGSTYHTTKGAWQSGNYIATANQVNGCNTGATNFKLAGVKLQPGSVATQFRPLPYQKALAQCQRYLYVINCSATRTYARVGDLHASSSTTANALVKLPVPMRSLPAIDSTPLSTYIGGGVATVGAASIDSAGSSDCLLNVSLTGISPAITNGLAGALLHFNTTTGSTRFSAEI